MSVGRHISKISAPHYFLCQIDLRPQHSCLSLRGPANNHNSRIFPVYRTQRSQSLANMHRQDDMRRQPESVGIHQKVFAQGERMYSAPYYFTAALVWRPVEFILSIVVIGLTAGFIDHYDFGGGKGLPNHLLVTLVFVCPIWRLLILLIVGRFQLTTNSVYRWRFAQRWEHRCPLRRTGLQGTRPLPVLRYCSHRGIHLSLGQIRNPSGTDQMHGIPISLSDRPT